MIPSLWPSRFSNGRLNFKHPFWAAAGPEKGIFAAVPLFFGPRQAQARRPRPPVAQRLTVWESNSKLF
jgi:hypothetical protein